jgi:hypothetical protein
VTEKGQSVSQLSDVKWVMAVAFVVDRTCLNELDTKLEGRDY